MPSRKILGVLISITFLVREPSTCSGEYIHEDRVLAGGDWVQMILYMQSVSLDH